MSSIVPRIGATIGKAPTGSRGSFPRDAIDGIAADPWLANTQCVTCDGSLGEDPPWWSCSGEEYWHRMASPAIARYATNTLSERTTRHGKVGGRITRLSRRMTVMDSGQMDSAGIPYPSTIRR